jgi:hypothetical protein
MHVRWYCNVDSVAHLRVCLLSLIRRAVEAAVLRLIEHSEVAIWLYLRVEADEIPCARRMLFT